MSNRKHASILLATILILLCVSSAIAAQGPAAITDLRVADNASIAGATKDTSSALIPGVTVTLINTQTGVATTQRTDAAGAYNFQNVAPGFYKITGELSGFSPDIQSNIQVRASSQIRLDLVLRVGGSALQSKVTEEVRLVWTALPGTGNTYVIERSGPGLTLFTPVAGPITESSYVVNTDGSDFDGGVTYQYRVSAIDSASNKSPASNSVPVRSTRLRNLPLVGNNVLDLLALLPGAGNNGLPLRPDDTLNRSLTMDPARPDSISLIYTRTSNRTLSFTVPDGSQTFSWGCPDCSFIVGPGGVGPAVAGNRGAMFKLSADSSTIQVTCRAVRCDVLTAQQIEADKGILRATGNVKERQLATDETMTIPATQRAFFTVNTR